MSEHFEGGMYAPRAAVVDHFSYNKAIENIYILNHILKPFLGGLDTPSVDEIAIIKQAAIHMDDSLKRVGAKRDIRRDLHDAIKDFIASDDHLTDVDRIRNIVKLKDELLELLKQLQLKYFLQQVEEFIKTVDEDKAKTLDKNLNKVFEDLNNFKDDLEDIRNALLAKEIKYASAIEDLNKIRHAARGLDNSWNEIGATILGTTAIPLQGALHEYLGSIDATITARDGDRMEHHIAWVNEHIDMAQKIQKKLQPALQHMKSPDKPKPTPFGH